jgi:hypothetical protein
MTANLPTLRRRVARLLAFLILVDLVLSLVGFISPELWFDLIHGAPAIDPQRFMQRTAAAWAAFLVLQLIALVRFRRDPAWLAVIAGVRLGDMFTDWTHAVLAPDMTWFGDLCLLSASPINLLAGLFLLRAHRQLTASR